jgi:hypothetical protein
VDRLRQILLDFRDRREINSGVNPLQLAILIVTTLVGSLMLEWQQRTPEPLNIACRLLEEYLETNIRAKESKA